MARATPLERIEMIRRGLAPALVTELAHDLRIAEDNLMLYLGLARAAVRRKLADDERLAPRESEGVMALAVFLGETLLALDVAVQANPGLQMDAAAWLGKWLRTPHAELAQRAPLQYMDVGQGRALVAELLASRR
ncbi:MAG: antitoxin Xre/MbcA/ParS toxin-binding domain-containing protein [Luteibacter sp.]